MTLGFRYLALILAWAAGFGLFTGSAFGQVFSDSFDTSLGEWVFWTNALQSDPHTYSLELDTQAGNPAPSARVSGDYDVLAGGGSRAFGMEREFSDIKYFDITFDWGVSSGWMSVTNLSLVVVNAQSGEALYTETLMPGGTLDTGWQHYPLRDLSSVLDGNTRNILIRFSMGDGWTANWDETFHIDNFQLRAQFPQPPPDVPLKTDKFDAGLDGWRFYTDIEAVSSHTYRLALDVNDGSPAPCSLVSGTYAYPEHLHGHMFGMEKDFSVSLPFVIAFDWKGSEGVQPTLQLVSAAEIRFTRTVANPAAETWQHVEPFDVSETVEELQAVTVRIFMPGTDGAPNSLRVDPCLAAASPGL